MVEQAYMVKELTLDGLTFHPCRTEYHTFHRFSLDTIWLDLTPCQTFMWYSVILLANTFLIEIWSALWTRRRSFCTNFSQFSLYYKERL